MKNKKIKKSLCGMTLVEIIIALAVFAIMGLLLVSAALSVEKHTRSANNLNSKVEVQGPIAEARNDTAAHCIDDSFEITVNSNITVNAEIWDTADYETVTDDVGATSYVKITDDSVNGELNLKYVNGIAVPTTT